MARAELAAWRGGKREGHVPCRPRPGAPAPAAGSASCAAPAGGSRRGLRQKGRARTHIGRGTPTAAAPQLPGRKHGWPAATHWFRQHAWQRVRRLKAAAGRRRRGRPSAPAPEPPHLCVLGVRGGGLLGLGGPLGGRPAARGVLWGAGRARQRLTALARSLGPQAGPRPAPSVSPAAALACSTNCSPPAPLPWRPGRRGARQRTLEQRQGLSVMRPGAPPPAQRRLSAAPLCCWQAFAPCSR